MSEEGGKERRRGEEKGGGERVFNGILPLILDDAQASWPTFSGSLGEVEHSRYHGQNQETSCIWLIYTFTLGIS